MVALSTGATHIRDTFIASQVPFVIDAYMVGMKAVFAIAVAASDVCTTSVFFGSWKRLHIDNLKKTAGGAGRGPIELAAMHHFTPVSRTWCSIEVIWKVPKTQFESHFQLVYQLLYWNYDQVPALLHRPGRQEPSV